MSRTAGEQYHGIVKRLEGIATDPKLLETRPDDGISLDDMLLRLKLWAADVQYDQESLDWAEKMKQVSGPLRERLQQLDQQCDVFDTALKQVSAEGKDQAEYESPTQEDAIALAMRNLSQAVDHLVSFTTPIQVAACVPREKRTSETISRANQDVINTMQPLLSKQSPYILLEKPLPIDQLHMLLGAVVVPGELLEAGASSDGSSLVRVLRDEAKVRIAQSTMENFSMPTQNNWVATSLTSFNRDAASLTQPNKETEAAASTHPSSDCSTTVRKWHLANAAKYFESFIGDHGGDLQKVISELPKANLALVSVLLTARMSGMTSSTSSETGPASPPDIFNHVRNEAEQIFAFGCLNISDRNFRSPTLSKQLSGHVLARYHIAPHFSIPAPPDGPLELGSILADINTADTPINKGSLIPVSRDELYLHEASGFQSTMSNTIGGKFGLWGKVFSMNRPDINASLTSDRDEEVVYRFDRLETVSFSPTREYITQSLDQDVVHDYMRADRYKSVPVYLVTGLKIARGAVVIQNRRKRVLSTSLRLQHGIPASTGADSAAIYENMKSTVVNNLSDFIFAIKLSKIRFKQRFFMKRTKELVVEDYNKGAAML